jgi:negative regulator of sigma E activity
MTESDRRDEGEEAFVRRVKAMLDEGNAHLDARVRSRLTQARHAALAQADSRPSLWLRQWAPAAGIAAAAVLAVLVWPSPPREQPQDEALNDLEIVLAGENLDMLENLDFYEWVDADAQNSI